MVLEKVFFDPTQSVTYVADGTKQSVDMVIKNPSPSAIMFKMKSTRPGLYKMRPVFGRIAAGDKGSIKFIYKGLRPGQVVPVKDHFTCIVAAAPGSSADVAKMWKQHKYKKELANTPMIKHEWKILYKGYNDHGPEMTLSQNDVSDVRGRMVVKKGTGLVDMEIEETNKTRAEPTPVNPPGGKAVLVMFRQQEAPFSESEDEESDSEREPDKDKKTTASASIAGKERQPTTTEMTTAPLAKLGTKK